MPGISQCVAGKCLAQFSHRAQIAGMQLRNCICRPPLHHRQMSQSLDRAMGVVGQLGIAPGDSEKTLKNEMRPEKGSAMVLKT